MKIALFHNLHPGGAKRALHEQARRLRDRGHTLDGYTLSTAAEGYLPLNLVCGEVYRYDLESPDGPRARFLEWLLKQRRLWRFFSGQTRDQVAIYLDVHRQHREQDRLEELYARMATDIDQRGYDIAVVHQCHLSLSPALLRLLKTPTLYYAQDTLRYVYEWSIIERPDWDAHRNTFYLRHMLGQTYPLPLVFLLRRKERQYIASTRAASLVLANSLYSREALVRTTGINPHVCYLGVDTEFFCPDPAVVREPVVLSVGALVSNKKHQFIIAAVATLPVEQRPRLRIIGYEYEFGVKALGRVAKDLLSLAESLGVDLKIEKEVSDEDLRDAYRSAAVVAFAPQLEPFGFIPLEAMACETPVVGVSEGGVRESIEHEVTGLLTGRIPQEFGAALHRVLTDKALASRLAANGREQALRRWSWERSVDELEAWSHKAAGATASSRPE